MAEVPENETLWNALARQAKARYPSHRRPGGMTWQAAKQVRQQYMLKGGQFVASKKEVPPQFRDNIKREQDKEKAEKARIKEKKKKSGLL